MIEANAADMLALKVVLNGIKSGVEKVLTKSINASIKTTQVQAVKLIGQDLSLTAKRIKQDFTQEKAKYSSLKGALYAVGEPVGLVNFQARSVKTGVSHKVKKSSARSTTKHAYIAKGKSGAGKHVFKRAYKGPRTAPVSGRNYAGLPDKYRLPTSRLTGPRIEDIYGKTATYNKVSKIAEDAFAKNVVKETETVLRRYG
jgi:uncharacterized protein YoxC